MSYIDFKIHKSWLDLRLETFMDAATSWATARKKDDYEEGLNWGNAFGIYSTLKNLELVDKETAAELRAVLFDRKEAKPCKSSASP